MPTRLRSCKEMLRQGGRLLEAMLRRGSVRIATRALKELWEHAGSARRRAPARDAASLRIAGPQAVRGAPTRSGAAGLRAG